MVLKQRAAEKARNELVVAAPFHNFNETDLEGKPLSICIPLPGWVSGGRWRDESLALSQTPASD
jgi:hypothetical protein